MKVANSAEEKGSCHFTSREIFSVQQTKQILGTLKK